MFVGDYVEVLYKLQHFTAESKAEKNKEIKKRKMEHIETIQSWKI